MTKNKIIKKKGVKRLPQTAKEYVDATEAELEGIYNLFNEQEYVHINDILNGAVGMEEY